MRMAQAFAPILRKNGGGAFVQMNSIASLKCSSNFATHSATKAASYSITQALRDLLNQQGTAVLSVHPGLIATDMSNAAGLAGAAEPPSVVAEGIIAALESGDVPSFSRYHGQTHRECVPEFCAERDRSGISEYNKPENHAIRLRNSTICPINSFRFIISGTCDLLLQSGIK